MIQEGIVRGMRPLSACLSVQFLLSSNVSIRGWKLTSLTRSLRGVRRRTISFSWHETDSSFTAVVDPDSSQTSMSLDRRTSAARHTIDVIVAGDGKSLPLQGFERSVSSWAQVRPCSGLVLAAGQAFVPGSLLLLDSTVRLLVDEEWGERRSCRGNSLVSEEYVLFRVA